MRSLVWMSCEDWISEVRKELDRLVKGLPPEVNTVFRLTKTPCGNPAIAFLVGDIIMTITFP